MDELCFAGYLSIFGAWIIRKGVIKISPCDFRLLAPIGHALWSLATNKARQAWGGQQGGNSIDRAAYSRLSRLPTIAFVTAYLVEIMLIYAFDLGGEGRRARGTIL